MASNDPGNTITLTMGTKEYTVDPEKIPYFGTLAHFQSSLGRENTKVTHDEIEYFDIALICIEKGFRNCFRLLGDCLNSYRGLCDTLDYLLVDVLGGRTLKDIADDFRSIKRPLYDIYKDESNPLPASTKLAKDSAFRLLYMLHTKDFEDKDSSKMFESVLYIISHRASFKHNVRSVILESYRERFSLTPKQNIRLDEWPVYVEGKPFDSGEDTTTAESDNGTDSDDYYGSD